MVNEIRIYVEGGGDQRSGKAAVQEGFSKFFLSLNEMARKRRIRWHVIACGSRQSTFHDFGIALRQHRDAFNVLLVDAEGPVTLSPWEHLQNRDHWRTQGIPHDHCQLMVQVMEAWIIADIETLRKFYGQGFDSNSIPRRKDVELIAKADVERALVEATRNTQRGEYHKIRHGPKILALVDVSKVRNRAQHCDRTFTTLSNKIGET
ncbi:MAG TPA: DUF4276 family protein [Thermodesulfobacteriota bacterium]|nr:DUF4276 family protein [Thermodesulfobacteriota bacterium]